MKDERLCGAKLYHHYACIFRALADRLEKNTQPLNRYEGFKGNGAVVSATAVPPGRYHERHENANGGTLSDDPLDGRDERVPGALEARTAAQEAHSGKLRT